MLTLGHELGHAVALARAAAAQPPIARGWPGVLFELPSLLAEIAAADALAEAYPAHATGVRLALAQNLAWSVFEAMTFCRVELDLYERRSRGAALTSGAIADAFLHRFGEAYGPALPITERDAVVLAARRRDTRSARGSTASSTPSGPSWRWRCSSSAPRIRSASASAASRCSASDGASAPVDQLARFGLDLGPATWERGARGARATLLGGRRA